MGMFDSFLDKVKCPKCGRILDKFQTKDFWCRGAGFQKGKEACYYALRIRTKEEEKRDLEELRKEYPELAKSPWGKLAGCLKGTNTKLGYIADGRHEVYTSCEKCKSWIIVKAKVKGKIFKGIVEVKVGKL